MFLAQDNTTCKYKVEIEHIFAEYFSLPRLTSSMHCLRLEISGLHCTPSYN